MGAERNDKSRSYITIYIRVYFSKIDPAGATGLYGDTDDTPATPSKKKIQKWQPGELERYTKNLVSGAQRFWNGVFWLKTPKTYDGLDYPDVSATHRFNLYWRFEREQALREIDAHYTIAVVRAQDGENFRCNSRLYSQNGIKSESLIPPSAPKFWTHFHEVGHLLGLGHVGSGGHTNVHNDNSPTAYGSPWRKCRTSWGKGRFGTTGMQIRGSRLRGNSRA